MIDDVEDKKNQERMLALLERIADALEEMGPERQFRYMVDHLPDAMNAVYDAVKDLKKREEDEEYRRAERENRRQNEAFYARRQRWRSGL